MFEIVHIKLLKQMIILNLSHLGLRKFSRINYSTENQKLNAIKLKITLTLLEKQNRTLMVHIFMRHASKILNKIIRR